MTVIPIDGNSTPSRSDDRAAIRETVVPANAVANFEESGLVAGHCRTVIEREVHIDAAKAEHSLEDSPSGGEQPWS